MKIEESVLVEKIFEKGRWWAVLEKSINGRRKMAFANYTWMLGNPSFKEIPKGYVIHHLDWDETNDDISNLALMQKHHHSAHHWKNKKIVPKIRVDIERKRYQPWEYSPITEPIIHKPKKGIGYYLYFREAYGDKSRAIRVYRYKNKLMRSLELAEKFKKEIWKGDNEVV